MNPVLSFPLNNRLQLVFWVCAGRDPTCAGYQNLCSITALFFAKRKVSCNPAEIPSIVSCRDGINVEGCPSVIIFFIKTLFFRCPLSYTVAVKNILFIVPFYFVLSTWLKSAVYSDRVSFTNFSILWFQLDAQFFLFTSTV